jgi:hypothetical protein
MRNLTKSTHFNAWTLIAQLKPRMEKKLTAMAVSNQSKQQEPYNAMERSYNDRVQDDQTGVPNF